MPLFRRNKPSDDAEKNGTAERPERKDPADKPADKPAEKAEETGIPGTPAERPAELPAERPADEEIPAAQKPAEPIPQQPQTPRFHTPEGFDFNRYFLAELGVLFLLQKFPQKFAVFNIFIFHIHPPSLK